MKKTGFVHDKRFLLHDTGDYHPETAGRVDAVYDGIQKAGLLPLLRLITPRPAEMQWIHAVHEAEYVRRFESLCSSGCTTIDYPDNQMCSCSFEIARLAVGGVLQAVDLLMEGEIDNAFCAVRPPGHHAEAGKAMGFCYFNNVAIAARYLQRKWGIERVAIVDFDVHHGNGTQHIFEADPSVYYYSMHEHPSFAFPGTGRAFETGSGAGTGFTRNHPMLPGRGDREYEKIMDEDFLPVFDAFNPQVVLVSAGFDAHEEDDMSGISLTTAGFSRIMQTITEMARRHADGRLISVLEGGYNLKRLGELAANHVAILLGRPV